MEQNRPQGREKHNVSGTGNVHKTGSGLGTGPVGNKTGYSNRPGTQTSSSNGGQRSLLRSRGRGRSIIWIAIIVIAFFIGRKMGFFGGSGYSTTTIPTVSTSTQTSSNQGLGLSSLLSDFDYSTSTTDYSSYISNVFTGNKPTLNTSVSNLARDKFTNVIGNSQDDVTIMVYMCGTDLESKSGMASSDIKEMCNAQLSDKVNLIIYTGGCKSWQNNVISNRVNQIYKVQDGGLVCLEKDMGSGVMTDPNTLTSFIKYCDEHYPANRMNLIFWDHGGGSISGFGYDEKNTNSGCMSLAQINSALKTSGVKFDFIGFDACLMATVENALMLSSYGDYLIASEETEPGVGWYYTNWLTKYSQNTSMPTIEIGQMIVDDFVDVCNQKCNGQKTTLSVVDLSELINTVPDELSSFASDIQETIEEDDYKAVSDARYATKEFAQSSKIDQIDLVHFAKNLNNDSSEALIKAITEAVKYNRTASCVKDAYGLSIYFPYNKTNKVDSMAKTYESIGMDNEYTKCIKEFANLQVSGQVAAGGTSSPLPSLLSGYTGYTNSTSTQPSGGSLDSVLSMLESLSGGSSFSISGFDTSALDFLFKGNITTDRAAAYISDNYFDASNLVWIQDGGTYKMPLSEDQWDLVHSLELNVFYDDGNGYIDLGLDNVYDFDDNKALIGSYDNTWLSIDKAPVAYYHEYTIEGDDYVISGYVPALLNGERVELVLQFTKENPYGFFAGARYDYANGETDAIAKDLCVVKKGDKLAFLCDYYNYDGTYSDTYQLGETITLGDSVEIGNIDIGAGNTSATYRFTDIYNQKYWSPVIPQ